MAAALGAHAVHEEAAALEQACVQEAEDIDVLERNVEMQLRPVIEGAAGAGAPLSLISVARPAGIEPATLGFGGQYSIH